MQNTKVAEGKGKQCYRGGGIVNILRHPSYIFDEEGKQARGSK